MAAKEKLRTRRASFLNHKGLWIVTLSGSREEMAYQHGELVQDRVQNTALPFFARKIGNSIRQSSLARQHKIIETIAAKTADFMLFARFRQALPPEDRAALAAFAEGAQVSASEVCNAIVVPDVGQWLISRIFGSRRLPAGAFGALPRLGCSTFSRMDPSGQLIVGRNLDYEGYGLFDQYPAVLRFEPSDSNEIPYTSFGSLGIHTAGITAANDAGLILSLHQTMVRAVRLAGTPILSLTENVIRKADSIDAAVALLKSSRFSGGWNIILASGREKRSVSVEVSADACEVRELDAALSIVTNHVHSETMAREEFSVDYRYYQDTRDRYARLREGLRAADSFSEQSAIDLIAGAAKRNNIQSMVFEPAKNRAWIAVTDTVGARSSMGRYVAVQLSASTLENGELRAKPESSHSVIRADALYRTAARIATEEGRFLEALDMILKAKDEDPRELLYPLMAAITSFRVATPSSDPNLLGRTTALFSKAEALGADPYQRALIQLFRGRCLDLVHSRKAALAEYRKIDLTLSKPLAACVNKHLRRPCSYRDLRAMVLDYALGDLFVF